MGHEVIRALLLLAIATACARAESLPEAIPDDTAVRSISDVTPDGRLPTSVAADLVTSRDSTGLRPNSVRAYALTRYASPDDFVAIGTASDAFRYAGVSQHVQSLGLQVRRADRATGEGVTLRAAAAFVGDRTEVHGEGTWNVRLSPTTGFELIANRDIVESIPALAAGIMSTFAAVSFDHALTDRTTVIAMPTYRRYSDGNEQKGLRGWLIYGLAPEHGLSLSMKARAYTSDGNGNGAYFSPGRYERAEIGLRLRRAAGDWRLFATADVGRERIDDAIEKPTRQLSLTARRTLGDGAGLGVQFAYFRASDSANGIVAADHYAWRMARVFVIVPF